MAIDTGAVGAAGAVGAVGAAGGDTRFESWCCGADDEKGTCDGPRGLDARYADVLWFPLYDPPRNDPEMSGDEPLDIEPTTASSSGSPFTVNRRFRSSDTVKKSCVRFSSCIISMYECG